MQCNHLCPEEVLSLFNAFGNLNDLVAAVVDHGVGTPVSITETFFLDFEPVHSFILIPGQSHVVLPCTGSY